MNILTVNDKKTKNLFHKVPKVLYKNDKNWTCPLDTEIEGIFNPDNNSCFKHGDAKRWILTEEGGNLAGRIAAFYDKNKAYNNTQPTGGIGFFECVNNQDAANLLFDTAKEWLKKQGMEAMDGPINFGENFVYWGLLVEGFTHQGYGMPYNFPYYKELFEKYEFKNYFEQYSFHDDLHKPYPERMRKFAEYIIEKPEYTFKHFEMKNAKKYIKDLAEMYNKIWADFLEDYTPLEFEDLYKIFEEAKAIINEKFIWFAYEGEKPIAFLVAFPDVNLLFKKMKNGKLNLINIIKLFLYRKSPKVINRARLLLSGVIPEYQRSMVVGGVYIKLSDTLYKNNIDELELSWVGDYNLTVNKMYSQFGATKEKTHITYRYLFDKNAEFKRFTNEQAEKFKKK